MSRGDDTESDKLVVYLDAPEPQTPSLDAWQLLLVIQDLEESDAVQVARGAFQVAGGGLGKAFTVAQLMRSRAQGPAVDAEAPAKDEEAPMAKTTSAPSNKARREAMIKDLIEIEDDIAQRRADQVSKGKLRRLGDRLVGR